MWTPGVLLVQCAGSQRPLLDSSSNMFDGFPLTSWIQFFNSSFISPGWCHWASRTLVKRDLIQQTTEEEHNNSQIKANIMKNRRNDTETWQKQLLFKPQDFCCAVVLDRVSRGAAAGAEEVLDPARPDSAETNVTCWDELSWIVPHVEHDSQDAQLDGPSLSNMDAPALKLQLCRLYRLRWGW